jgi:predicted CxxxxCH...CXXCH cytochrome family protein
VKRLAVLALVAVVGCADERERPAAAVSGGVHLSGILDETSENFHGKELARRDYDFELCATCHGEDFSGGAAKTPCTTCHEDGPTACTTCHREDTESAPHAAHRAASIGCAECHTVPERWDSEGHIRRDGLADHPPAEVMFGARAALTIDPADRGGPPTYTAGRCSNVYCHGDVLGMTGAAAPRPRWDDPIESSCNRCHGAPPPSHAQNECATCHPSGAPHIDGSIQIGVTAGCDGCHGTAGNPAPPRDLDGNELTTMLGVGAHRAHLVGPSRLRAPIACETCHTVPATIDAPGHIDSTRPAEVSSAVEWDRTSATCGTWCHGNAMPVWTQQGGIGCGTCHAIPPATPAHAGATSITTCTTCHPRVLDAVGNFLFTNGVSEHLDGDVDVF